MGHEKPSEDLSSSAFIPVMTANRRPNRRDVAGMASVKLREWFNGLPGDDAAEKTCNSLSVPFSYCKISCVL
jgi:hypothetical protein